MDLSRSAADDRAALEAMYDTRPKKPPVTAQLLLKSLELVAPSIERLFGKPIQSDGSQVATSDTLTAELLEALFTHRICGIRLPGFCPLPLAERLRKWVHERSGLANWKVRSGDGQINSDTQYGIGMPWSEGLSSKEKFVKYFTEALPSTRRLRLAAAPDMSPIDRLRLELEEVWPQGARIARYDGRYKFVGVSRVMSPDTLLDGVGRTEGICHVDSFPVTSTDKGEFSVNVYLEVPARGGELDIWNISPSLWDMVRNYSTFKCFNDSFNEQSQRILREALPPQLTVKPQVGDIIIINTSRPHSVRGFSEGWRVTLQSFLAYQRGEPLMLDS